MGYFAENPKLETRNPEPKTQNKFLVHLDMKLFVKNIEESVNEVLLEAIFKQFGEVLDTKIVYDKITWESKGFGFVEYKKKEDALKAIEGLNGKELVGKKLIVSEAVEKPR